MVKAGAPRTRLRCHGPWLILRLFMLKARCLRAGLRGQRAAMSAARKDCWNVRDEREAPTYPVTGPLDTGTHIVAARLVVSDIVERVAARPISRRGPPPLMVVAAASAASAAAVSVILIAP